MGDVSKITCKSFKWVEKLPKFNDRFIKSHNENSDIGYFLEVYVKHPKKLFNLYKNLPCLPERKNLFDLHKDLSPLLERKKLEKVKKLVYNIEDKKKYVIHIRALKQALNQGLILKRVHRKIQFNQKA